MFVHTGMSRDCHMSAYTSGAWLALAMGVLTRTRSAHMSGKMNGGVQVSV